jgi:TetR/AcrR family transcriptional repressor of nem operon
VNSVGHQSGPAERGVDFPTLSGIWRLMARTDVRERVLQAGFALFSTKGFNATGVKDIVDAAGVPKGSFYAYFESKDMLGCAVVDRYWEEASDKLEQLVSSPGSPVERLKLHFRELSGELITSKYLAGCLLGRFSAEIAGQSPRMLEHVSDAFARWSAGIARVVQEAAEAGELRQGLETSEVADFLLNSWEGAVLRAKAESCDTALTTFENLAFGLLFQTAGKS